VALAALVSVAYVIHLIATLQSETLKLFEHVMVHYCLKFE